MVWVVLLVALASALAALTAVSLTARVRAARDPAWFCCRLARPARRWRGLPGRHGWHGWRRDGLRWGRLRTRARWVDRVLLVQTGLLRIRTLAMAVTLPSNATVQADSDGRIRRLGPRPQILRVTDEDGRPLQVAAAHWDRTRLVGPFLAAAIPGLPAAPPERRPRHRP